jgi:hypothetical protein
VARWTGFVWLRVGTSGEVDWVFLAQGRDKWRALAITVLNFGFHTERGISLLFADLLP